MSLQFGAKIPLTPESKNEGIYNLSSKSDLDRLKAEPPFNSHKIKALVEDVVFMTHTGETGRGAVAILGVGDAPALILKDGDSFVAYTDKDMKKRQTEDVRAALTEIPSQEVITKDNLFNNPFLKEGNENRAKFLQIMQSKGYDESSAKEAFMASFGA